MTLTKLMSLSGAELKKCIQAINPAQVKGRSVRRRFEKIRRKESGFTLLELLVVVAILAAIGSLGALMLQDTDRKAAAGAHVAMMGELSNAIQVYAQMHQGNYPDNWDSLFQGAAGALGAPLEILSEDLYDGGAGAPLVLSALGGWDTTGTPVAGAEFGALSAKGITQVRVVDTGADGCAAGADMQTLINSKLNDVVATNIYKLPIGTVAAGDRSGGCGAVASTPLAAASPVLVWDTATAENADRVRAVVDDRLIAFGIGPSSDLFDPTQIGALAAVPVYRHVAPDEYAGFIVLFHAGNQGTGTDTVRFHAIIDGAGDTQEEELGELDNTRAT